MSKIKKIDVILNGTEVGHLGLTPDNLCVFEYTPEFLSNGFSISPLNLPLKSGIFIAKNTPFYGGFGVFDDSLPDGWGLLILDRFLRKKGLDPNRLTWLDRLSLVGAQGRGALEFYPQNSEIDYSEFHDFENLALEAKKILQSDDYIGNGIKEFQLRGGSPGGARPKIFIKEDNREWLVKFPSENDPQNIGIKEYEYSLLAKKCGIEMPDTKLIENKYYSVERFDRFDGKKIHVVSVAGLLNADYRIPSIDYEHIFRLAGYLCRDIRESWKIYRLMVFNYFIGNKDDHAKNFAFICEKGKWRFAPAFDLLPSDGINGFRTTSINNSIEPTEKDILQLASKMNLDIKEATNILEEIRSILFSK